jgi:hypothetical protein
MVRRHIARSVASVLLLCGTLFAASTTFNGYTFEAHVVKSNGKRYREFIQAKRAMLKVRPNEEYSIVVHNPLPVRVAVAVSIDGLNSIDGKRTTLRNARKWMIEPNSSLTVAGWQTGKETLRKFLFTRESESLAEWREEKEGKPFTRNLGVIGIGWFWNSAELEQALHPPQPFVEESRAEEAAPRASRAPAAPAAKSAKARAGTGQGKQLRHVVTTVAFEDDAGMYSVKDILKIYYEFAKEPPEPLPFIDESEDEGRFTPDMNK